MTKAFIKIVWALSLCLVTGGIASAQKELPKNRPYADYRHFFLGFHVGVHTQDLIIANQPSSLMGEEILPMYAEVPVFSPGFSVGIIFDYSPMLGIDLRIMPTLHLAERTISFSSNAKDVVDSFSLKSNMIEIPLLLKYSSSRLNNIRPYIVGGPYASLMIGQKEQAVIRFKPFDYGFKIGVGCDIYLPFFKLTPEFSLSYGIPNIIEYNRPDLIDDRRYNFTKIMARANSRMVLLTFVFE